MVFVYCVHIMFDTNNYNFSNRKNLQVKYVYFFNLLKNIDRRSNDDVFYLSLYNKLIWITLCA